VIGSAARRLGEAIWKHSLHTATYLLAQRHESIGLSVMNPLYLLNCDRGQQLPVMA